jgi:predicted transport protein
VARICINGSLLLLLPLNFSQINYNKLQVEKSKVKNISDLGEFVVKEFTTALEVKRNVILAKVYKIYYVN